MTMFMRLLIPIIALVVLLFWKGSSLMIKLTLLAVPFIGLVAWFAHEGAFRNIRNMGLADLYGVLSITAFLLCYETGMLIHRWFLIHKGLNAGEDNIFLVIGLVLLLVSLVYLVITLNS